MSANQSLRLRMGAILLSIITLAACSGGGGYDGGSGGGSGAVSVGGGGVKGPMAGAVVEAYAIEFSDDEVTQGALIASGETNAQAKITGLALPFPQSYPYLLVFKSDADTVDLTTGVAPVIGSLKTVLTSTLAAKGEQVYATPLTSMAVDIAFENYQDTAESDEADLQAALNAAAAQVASTVGFGLDANKIDIFDTPPLVDDTVAIGEAGDGATSVADVKAYRAAVEALTAVVAAINEESTDDASTPETVLNSLAKDLAGDGEIDGDDGQGNVVVEPTSLDVLDKDPETLVIPNTGGKTVADIEEIVADETGDTGNAVSAEEQQAIKDEQTTTQPAARNPDRDGDGVTNAKDDYPDDAAADRDTDGDGKPDVAYSVVEGMRGDALPSCSDNAPKRAAPSASFECSDEDDDADNVSDVDEATDGTDPLNADSDDDGIGDGDEKALGTNPLLADSDEDGVSDIDDNCPVNANPNQLDADEDGKGAACDENDTNAVPDQDGDDVPDESDNCLAEFNPAQVNTDGDDFGDACDSDDDGDEVPDASDAFPLNASESSDNDKDGIGDNADTDDDNDGVSDDEEDVLGTDPFKRDTDGDGVLDGADAFPLDDTESRDTDKDGTGDNADTDDDNDNVLDDAEAAQGTNPRVADTDRDGKNDDTDNCPVDVNADQANNDDDELGDVCDNDDDNDTFEDDVDNCPLVASDDQTDTDQDGQGDACDENDDNDAFADDVDNCPLVASETNDDFDNDGLGDACDLDADGDGVDNDADECPTTPEDNEVNAQGCAAGESDGDGDGVFDNVDNCPGLNEPDQTDTDGDGQGDACDDDDDNDNVSDVQENTDGTNPLLADTDADGTNDDTDNCPLTASENQLDTDQDGDGNACDDDDDNDNVPDTDEAGQGTDPLLADTDSDGVNDDTDNCPVDSNANQDDLDQDGVGDVCDSDRDGDGVDNDQDAFPDNANETADADSDEIGDNDDNCPAVANPGQEDADSDTLGDACDTDDDNDGTLDEDDDCPATSGAQAADTESFDSADGCHEDQREQVSLDGAYRFVEFGYSLSGSGPASTLRYSGIETEAGVFKFSFASQSDGTILLSADERNDAGYGVYVDRYANHEGGLDSDHGTYNYETDPCVEDCIFTESLQRYGDLAVLNGLVDVEIDEEYVDFETGHVDVYDHESSKRIVFTPLVIDGVVQAAMFSEFSNDREFLADDTDDAEVDPDKDGKLDSDLEPKAGDAFYTGAFGLLSLGLPEPVEQLEQSDLAGNYGLVSVIASTLYDGDFDAHELGLEQIRGELVVDESGDITGTRYRGQQLTSKADGSFFEEDQDANASTSGTILPSSTTDSSPGQLDFTWNGNDFFENAYASPDASIAAATRFGEYDSNDSSAGEDIEFAVLLNVDTAPGDITGMYRLNMLAREFGSSADVTLMQVQGAELTFDATATDCRQVLDDSTTVSCYSGTLTAEDGHSFFEGRHTCGGSDGYCFGTFYTDGTASDGDYEEGVSFTIPVRVSFDSDGNDFVLDLLETDDNGNIETEAGLPVVDDSYRGYIGSNGAMAFVGGSVGDNYGNMWMGLGFKVEKPAEQAVFDNVAPVVEAVSVKSDGTDVTQEAPAAPGAGVVLTPSITDNEDDTLTYEWVAYAGELSATDTASVTWTAPSNDGGSLKLELRVSDGLSTTVEFVDVYWGVSEGTLEQKATVAIVEDDIAEDPEDIMDWLLMLTPDTFTNGYCEDGSLQRSHTRGGNEVLIEPEDNVEAGDIVTYTFSDCVVGEWSFNGDDVIDERDTVVSGTWRFDVSKASETEFDWTSTLTDVRFIYEENDDGSGDLEVVEDERDNGVFFVKQTGSDAATGSPEGAIEQVVTGISFVGGSYTVDLYEEESLLDTATIHTDSTFTITEWFDESSDDAFAGNLVADFGYSVSADGASSDFQDLRFETDAEGVLQYFDNVNDEATGSYVIRINTLEDAPVADPSGWDVYVDVEYGDDCEFYCEPDLYIEVDTNDDQAVDFAFEATYDDLEGILEQYEASQVPQ